MCVLLFVGDTFVLTLVCVCMFVSSLFSPSWYSLLICCHPLSTTYIFFSKNHQSLISLCITSSLESTSCLIPQPCIKHPADDVTLSNSPPTCLPLLPSIAHSLFNSRLKTHFFSTNLFHHSLLAPTWTAFSDYTGPDLLCSTVLHF